MSSQRLMKGALTYIATQTEQAQPLTFQYNPETVTRLQTSAEKAGSITESIRFRLVLSAVDAMEQGEPEAAASGIYPQLAALEELMAQQTRQQRGNWLDWLLPTRITGFVAWTYGERVLPVKIQRMNIREVLHNNQLKPVHATVDLTLRVLTEQDLRGNAQGRAVLNRYEQYRRASAKLAQTGSA